MITVADARWGRLDGTLDVAVPVEDTTLLAAELAGDGPDAFDRGLLDGLRPGALVFDLGASVGSFSLRAAMRGATVVAVDASPRRTAHLRCSVDTNALASVHVVHAAITARGGSAHYLTRRRDRRVVEGSSSRDLVVVPALAVSELVARFGPPDLVRVNVPGWEREALSGLAAPVIGVRADLIALGNRGGRLADLALQLGDAAWCDGDRRRPVVPGRPPPEFRVDLLNTPATDPLPDDERIRRCVAEARRNPDGVRARLATDLRDCDHFLDDARVQALLERLLLDPAERVARAARWWRAHPARRTTLVDRAHALQAVLADRLSLD